MFRLLLIALLFALIFWVIRGYGQDDGPERPQEMVRDALTGVYFPKSEAVSVVRQGETLYFTSVENRDRYLANLR